MEHPPAPAIFVFPDPPPSSRSIDLSPLEFVLALIAIIAIPALIYTFFYSIKCPPSPFRSRSHHRRGETTSSDADTDDTHPAPAPAPDKAVAAVKYRKESHAKEIGNECPVCLSGFADGEAVKQLSACKHSFHSPCIDLWLNSHSNCPVCRASVDVQRPESGGAAAAEASSGGRPQGRGGLDLHQGLPDLV